MPGTNLLQSSQDSRGFRGQNLMDKSLIGSFVLLFIALATWGGIRWYMKVLDDKAVALDAVIQTNASQLHSKTVDRVADFDARVQAIGTNMTGVIETKDKLSQLERLVIPNVVLTGYKYDAGDNTVVVNGTTDNYRYVALQIMSLKSEALFSDVTVEALGRTTEGKITFTLSSKFSGSNR